MDQRTKPLPHPESDPNATEGRSHKVDGVEEPPGPYKDEVPSQPLRRDGAWIVALQDRIEGYVIRFLEAKGLRKLEGNTSSLALRACPPDVVIHEPSAVPANFQTMRPEVVVDRPAIKAAIEAGQDVPVAICWSASNSDRRWSMCKTCPLSFASVRRADCSQALEAFW